MNNNKYYITQPQINNNGYIYSGPFLTTNNNIYQIICDTHCMFVYDKNTRSVILVLSYKENESDNCIILSEFTFEILDNTIVELFSGKKNQYILKSSKIIDNKLYNMSVSLGVYQSDISIINSEKQLLITHPTFEIINNISNNETIDNISNDENIDNPLNI